MRVTTTICDVCRKPIDDVELPVILQVIEVPSYSVRSSVADYELHGGCWHRLLFELRGSS